MADAPGTPSQVLIRDGIKHLTGTAAGNGGRVARRIAARTYGDRQPGAVVMLNGIYRLHGSAGDRLLSLLPDVTLVPAGPRTRGALELLSAEAERDEPGQDAVLNRLLDLVLVIALRSWGASAGTELPTWLGAVADPAIGAALTVLHADPRRAWTTAALASQAPVPRRVLRPLHQPGRGAAHLLPHRLAHDPGRGPAAGHRRHGRRRGPRGGLRKRLRLQRRVQAHPRPQPDGLAPADKGEGPSA